jgi:integrase
MATINKLPSGRWRVRIRLAGQRPVGRTFSDKQAAKDWARAMEGNRDQIEAFPDAEARRRTVANAIDAYMLDYAGRDASLAGRLAWWRDHCGALSLVDITVARINDNLRQLGREHAHRYNGKAGTKSLGRVKGPATINRYLRAISSVLTWCVDQGWLAKNPAIGIRTREEPRGRVRWLNDEERAALLKACDASAWPMLGLLVRLALSTGARQSELLNLCWRDVNLKTGIAYVRQTKNDEPRVLPLITPVRKLLKAQTEPDGFLFPGEGDTQQPYKGMRKHWLAALAAAKITDFRFHDLRHSCASYLAMNGATPLEIGDVLGHKTLAMVRRYSHLSSKHKQRLSERVLGALVE